MIETVILAGGLGKRLRDAVPNLPKPLAPVLSAPFITLLFKQLINAEIDKATLAIGYMHEKVIDTFGNRFQDLSLEYVVEDDLLGTGGAIVNALKGKNYDNALIFNGDSFCNISLNDFKQWHLTNHHPASLVLNYQENRERYGGVSYDTTTGKIMSFVEKKEGLPAGYINAGVYLFSEGFVNSFPQRFPLSLETEILPNQLENLYGWPTTGEFIDIGTPDSYSRAQIYLERFL